MSDYIDVYFGPHRFRAYREGFNREFSFPCSNVLSFLFQEEMLEVNIAKMEEAIKNGWFSPVDYLAFRAQMGYTFKGFLELAERYSVPVGYEEVAHEAERPTFRCA